MLFLETMWEVLTEDCLLLLPILFLTFFFIEYLEHRAGDKLVKVVERSHRSGPLFGALLGCIPQCSFSVSCSHLYNEGIVTAGTLVAVFLSTSDEALPVLLSTPNAWGLIGKMLVIKVLVALIAGFSLDLIYKYSRQQADFVKLQSKHDCHVQKTDIKELILDTLKHTLLVWGILYIITLAMTLLMGLISKENIQAFLLPGFFQPFLAGLFGLIPNCAVSVVLVELHLNGLISFGSMMAGLCSAAGMGILVLFKGKRGSKNALLILGVCYAASVLTGLILQLLA